jgi:regulator of RNase E activity RraA
LPPPGGVQGVAGAIRDLEGIFPLDMGEYYRGVHPAAIHNVMLTGINVPVWAGNATVMPGDVVFGDRRGVCFVRPYLVQEVLEKAETEAGEEVGTTWAGVLNRSR